MKVEIVTPEDYQGDVMGDVSRRRGVLQGSDTTGDGSASIINAMIPLGEMFGYATALRSQTQAAPPSPWNSITTSRLRPTSPKPS